MAKKSGKSFSKHYNGSKGSDGSTRSSSSSNWGEWKESSSEGKGGARVRRHNSGGGEIIARSTDSNTKASRDHLHYYDNKDGQRICKDKKSDTRYISEDFGNAVRNFFGW